MLARPSQLCSDSSSWRFCKEVRISEIGSQADQVTLIGTVLAYRPTADSTPLISGDLPAIVVPKTTSVLPTMLPSATPHSPRNIVLTVRRRVRAISASRPDTAGLTVRPSFA